MEKVVYILGAGFSAPLGIPVMSNFIVKAKDLYFSDQEKYGHFDEIFTLLNQMSVIKNYFKTDLYNIEEILSILEMNNYLSGSSDSEKFKVFLNDVIEHYTPIEKNVESLPGNWYDFVFGRGPTRGYVNFVAELFNLSIRKIGSSNNTDLIFEPIKNPNVDYSVISLNYDLVLENALYFLSNNYYNSKHISFNKDLEDVPNTVRLSKLHGCIELGNIVPPTWNKSSNSQLANTWKAAQKQLREANHIRIIGYSLPISDSYMKYMIKSSLLESKHLKSLDVITLDPTGEVKERYDDFIDFNYYKFKNGNVTNYLENLKPQSDFSNRGERIYNLLETTHSDFMYS
ncbi:SIR2 family protein [Paenibacillus odorifer]|uniref:SIR2 family protein n=1 Tax=Paenibacillus odorifer TaxID=189426 RepID=UPI00096E0BD7|nr:SIR2 family protein [Paenibacillus odorifer]OMD09847.1 hypothetical protein BJP50_29380 [Paenibacillus odorifer]